MMTHNFNLMN